MAGPKFSRPQPHSETGDRHETRVRPEFEPSALTPATFSLRRSSASIELHRLWLSHQARRRFRVTSRKGVADEDSRPIIGLANVTPTNSIELCRSRRAGLGAHHFKGYSTCPYRAGAYDLTAAHRSPQRGIPSLCAGETKAAIALGVTAAPFTLINSYGVTSRNHRSGRRTIRADYIAAAVRRAFVNSIDIAGVIIVTRGGRKVLLEADAVPPQLRTISVGNLVEIDRRGPRAQSIRLIFENNIMSWWSGQITTC